MDPNQRMALCPISGPAVTQSHQTSSPSLYLKAQAKLPHSYVVIPLLAYTDPSYKFQATDIRRGTDQTCPIKPRLVLLVVIDERIKPTSIKSDTARISRVTHQPSLARSDRPRHQAPATPSDAR
ncbi:hypothetical protein OPQ81_007791 [Rhizoctonia solani]|nr:hypothetical protein OPQ81_007791 [Rhizoctonia solani]